MDPRSAHSVDDCGPAQLKTLLSLARPRRKPSIVAPFRGHPEMLLGLLAEFASGGDGLGVDFLAAVTSGQTPLAALSRLKEVAKVLHSRQSDSVTRDAATVLYHAIIAAALVSHGTNISTRPLKYRATLYGELADLLETHALGRIFKRACELAGETENPGTP